MSTNSTSAPRVWLITGVSSGFGRAITEAALAAGDTVAGVVRRPELVADLVDSADGRFSTVELDVTDTPRIRPAVAGVVERLGRIDVLVNNAGTGMVGAVEETTDAELRALFDVNFFAPVEMVRAVAPYMRARRSGTVVQMSSYCGHAAYPGFSAYCSSKFAIEGLSESLAAELAPLGVRVLLVEPGAFRTNFFGDRIRQSEEIADYATTVGQNRALVKEVGVQPGDPAKAAAAILMALSNDSMPLRLPLGDDSVEEIRTHLEMVRRDVDRWEPVSRSTAFETEPGVADWGPARV